MASVPSVTTMEGMPTKATSAPLRKPSHAPTAVATRIVAMTGSWGACSESRATTMPERARFAATDRSMPRVRITTIWARAIMARMAVSVSTPLRLPGVRNTGARAPTASTSPTRISASRISRP
jgi:hypothetical protein